MTYPFKCVSSIVDEYCKGLLISLKNKYGLTVLKSFSSGRREQTDKFNFQPDLLQNLFWSMCQRLKTMFTFGVQI